MNFDSSITYVCECLLFLYRLFNNSSLITAISYGVSFLFFQHNPLPENEVLSRFVIKLQDQSRPI
ncbi:hypothetical protein VAL01S_13_00120 [Vibrio alginolyticus NBRC 15630 = ATCC 17749]|nr:hypothetical protein VAL01S_13_00120 [Vibrio alginolyticus NBRC 15630 = ATCC 17749]